MYSMEQIRSEIWDRHSLVVKADSISLEIISV